MRFIGIVLALVFAVVAIVYFLMPAGSLPGFFPGYEAGSTVVHVKHGIAAVVAAVVLFAVAGFASRR
jgi:ammonia channel protein AmtB